MQIASKVLLLSGIMAIFSAAIVPAAQAVPNSLTITETGGVTTSNYPVQLGRPFVQGEIAGCPQALVNGAAVATQSDVKQRWPGDGSVKHAVISFLIPNLSANQTVTLTFQDQGTCSNTPC